MAIQLDDLVARLRLDTAGLRSGMASVNGTLESVGSKSTAVGKRMSLGLTAPLVGIAVAGVNLAASFDKTMRQVAIATDGPSKALSELAIRMGAETVFSANEAAEAMLELAKGGMSAAQIQGGVLASTMKLATVGGTDLATASTYASTAMNQFGLQAKDADSIVVALAGAANAGSASVDSLAQGLGNVGGVAKNMGLSIQETTGILSQLDSAGIKGAEGGTALRSMLNGLTPSSLKAKSAMQEFGLSFQDAQGNFLPMADVAEQLQQKLGGLSQAQRAATLETIFGTYGQQAATQLMNGGREAVEKYTKAAYDQKTTQELANAAMEGTSGALERAKGSIETAALMIGNVLAPYVERAAAAIEYVANLFTNLPSSMQGAIVALGALLAIIGPLLIGFGFMATAIGVIGLPVIGVGLAVAGLAAALAYAYTQSSAFRAGVATAFAAVQTAMVSLQPVAAQVRTAFMSLVAVVVPIVMQIVNVFRSNLPQIRATAQSVFASLRQIVQSAMQIITSVVRIATSVITTVWRAAGSNILAIIQVALSTVLGVVRGAFTVLQGIFQTVSAILRGDWQGAWDGIKTIVRGAWQVITSIVSGSFTVLVETVKGGVKLIGAALRALPGLIRNILAGLAGIALAAGQDLIRGLIDGIQSMAGAAADAAKAVVKGALDGAKGLLGIHSPSTVFRDEVGKMIGKGLVQGIVGTASEVRAAMHDLISKLRDAGRDQLAKMVVETRDKLTKWGDLLESKMKRLDALKDKMHELRDAARQLSDAVLDTFQASGSLLAAQAQVDEEGNTLPLTYADVATHVNEAAFAAEKFAANLVALKAAGLSQEQIDELARAGPEAALAVTNAIIAAGPVAITELNAMQARITAAGTATAQLAAENMYGTAIASTQGFIDGLNERIPQIEHLMRKLARKMIRALKDELGIHSPSRKLREVGVFGGQGLADGLLSMQSTVAAAAGRLADAATIEPGQLAGLQVGAAGLGTVGPIASPNTNVELGGVRVFLGDRELTDIVRVEQGRALLPLRTAVRTGAI